MSKISDLTVLDEAPAVGDLLEIIDVSDTTMAATGTNKKITTANLLTIANDSVTAAKIADWYAYDILPIALAADGAAAPDALNDRTTRPPYQYRTFAHASTEDVNFVWFVPSDLSGATIQYRIKYLVTHATGPTDEGVVFTLAGVSIGDAAGLGDPTNAAKGTVVTVTDTALTAIQWDILVSDWSGDVTVTDLLAGEIAELNFTRDHDHASDTYAQVVGVLAVELRYVQNVAK